MADTPVDVTSVAADTDDLGDFEKLLYGKAEATADAPTDEPDEVDEDITPADDSGADEHDDTDEAPDSTEEDEAEEDEDEEAPEPEPKRRPNARERINELTAEKYAEKRRADALEIELARLKEVQPKQEKAAPAPKADRPAPDDLNDDGELKYPMGEFDPEFVSDRMKYEFENYKEELARERAEEAEKAKAQAAAADLDQRWAEKLVKAEEGIEDLRPTIATLEHEFADLNPDLGVYIAETIMEMDRGPEVLYYLANNLDEARKITTAGQRGATIALGKIEARIEAAINGEIEQKKVVQPRQTRAPVPPITTRGNSGRTTVTPDTDDLDAFESLFYKKK